MKTNEYMKQTEQYVLHTYNRFPLVIDHGEGVHLYDTDGKAYPTVTRTVIVKDHGSCFLIEN